MGGTFRGAQRESRELAPRLGWAAAILLVATVVAVAALFRWPQLEGILVPLCGLLALATFAAGALALSMRSFGRED